MRRALPLAVLVVVAACGGGSGGGAPGEVRVTAMTRNLFIGTGLDALFAPEAALNLPLAVRVLFEEVQASDPPARMARIAGEIAARRPDVIGLQEAAIFRTLVPPAATETVEYDFVELLLGALRTAHGLSYRLAAQTTNFDRSLGDDRGRVLRLTDRDAILVRDGIGFRDPLQGSFSRRLELPFGLFSISIPRGWCAVTAEVGGTALRIVDTHLEAADDPVQEAQAAELAQLFAAESRPVVLLGDLNSNADRISPPASGEAATASYGTLRAAGFSDTWERLHPGEAGLSCCFPTDLRTAAPLRTRIDVVLVRGALTPLEAEVFGEEPADRTAGGLWPSDHAGVVATLRAP